MSEEAKQKQGFAEYSLATSKIVVDQSHEMASLKLKIDKTKNAIEEIQEQIEKVKNDRERQVTILKDLETKRQQQENTKSAERRHLSYLDATRNTSASAALDLQQSEQTNPYSLPFAAKDSYRVSFAVLS